MTSREYGIDQNNGHTLPEYLHEIEQESILEMHRKVEKHPVKSLIAMIIIPAGMFALAVAAMVAIGIFTG